MSSSANGTNGAQKITQICDRYIETQRSREIKVVNHQHPGGVSMIKSFDIRFIDLPFFILYGAQHFALFQILRYKNGKFFILMVKKDKRKKRREFEME